VQTTKSASRLDTIRAIYGPAVAKQLMPLSLAVGPPPTPEIPLDGAMSFTLEALISGLNYQSKGATQVGTRVLHSSAFKLWIAVSSTVLVLFLGS
jgi:hypothetical protein